MRPYGAAGCAVAQGATPTIHQRRAAYHLATATQPRYYLDRLDSIDIWYLVSSGVYKLGCTRPQAAAS